MEFTLTIAGDEVLRRHLLRWGDLAQDMSPALDALADDFTAMMQRQFDTEGAYLGTRWQQLSDSYGPWKSQRYPGQPILQRDGDLAASLSSRHHPAHVEAITDTQMAIGTGVGYAVYHQSTRPRRKLPRRPIVEMTEDAARRWAKTLQLYLATGEARMMGLGL